MAPERRKPTGKRVKVEHKAKGCFICGSSQAFNEHHVIPQAYDGGNESPVVDLCSNCHQNIHSYALKSVSKNPTITNKLFTDEQMLRAGPLIQYIAKSILESRSNPNMDQQMTLTIKPTRRMMQMLHCLKMDAGFTNMQDFTMAILKSYIRNKM